MNILVSIEEYDNIPNRGRSEDAPPADSLPKRILFRGALSYQEALTSVEMFVGLPVKKGRADFIPSNERMQVDRICNLM